MLLAAAAALLVPAAVQPTAAAWTDLTLAGARVAVAPADCGATGVFTARAAAALLAGSVQGAAVAGAPAVAGADTGPRTSAGSVRVPLPAASGAGLPVALAGGGAWDQSARTSGTGASSASVAGTAPLGVDVSALLARSPSATGALPGLTAVYLDVGPLSASAALDGCALAWGDSGALTRTAAVSTLTLRFTDTAVVGALRMLAQRGTTSIADLGTRSAAAAPGIGQAAADGLLAAVRASIGTASASGAAGSAGLAVVGGPDVAGTATGTQQSGVAVLDVATGASKVDLQPAAAPRDAELVTADRAGFAASGVAAALRQRSAALSRALDAAREGVVVTVHAAVDVVMAGVEVATVAFDASAPASSWAAGSVLLPGATVQVLTSAAPAGLADAVTSRLPALLLPKVQQAVLTGFLAGSRTDAAAAATADGTAVDGAVQSLGTHLAAAPGVLSVVLSQQAAIPADSWTGTLAAGESVLTALRVRVRDGSGVRADLFLGDVLVGPDRPAFR